MVKYRVLIASLLMIIANIQGAAQRQKSRECRALPVERQDVQYVESKVARLYDAAFQRESDGKRKCPYCKDFWANLNIHIRTHMGNLYRCNCGRNFTSQGVLSTHIQATAARKSRARASELTTQSPLSGFSAAVNNVADQSVMSSSSNEVVALPLTVQVSEYETWDGQHYDHEWDQVDRQAEYELNLLASRTCEGFYFNGDPEQNEFDDNAQGAEDWWAHVFEE